MILTQRKKQSKIIFHHLLTNKLRILIKQIFLIIMLIMLEKMQLRCIIVCKIIMIRE